MLMKGAAHTCALHDNCPTVGPVSLLSYLFPIHSHIYDKKANSPKPKDLAEEIHRNNEAPVIKRPSSIHRGACGWMLYVKTTNAAPHTFPAFKQL